MDLSDPTRAVVPTLDGAVLAVLATAGRPMSVGQVAAASARGSEIGIRRCLERLVEQGTVRTMQMGRNQVHELNRQHIAAGVAVALAGLRNELWRRLRAELAEWRVPAVYAAVFGSAARGDGDEQSDIDLLVVHPVFDGERKPRDVKSRRKAAAADPSATPAVLPVDARQVWEAQIDALREHVEAWTGNPLQTVDISLVDWIGRPAVVADLLAEVDRDGIQIVGIASDAVETG